MGRTAKPRENYRQDAINVSRIIGALEVDATSDPHWVSEVTETLQKAMTLLLNQRLRKSHKKASAA